MPLAAAAFTPGGPWRRAALGYVAGYVFFASTFWWLNSLAALYRNPVSVEALPLLLALYLGLFFAFWAWFLGALLATFDPVRSFDRSLRNLALGALGGRARGVAHEWVRERLFGGFGWNPLGVAFASRSGDDPDCGGHRHAGLSWLVAFANLMGVIIVRRIVGELGPNFSRASSAGSSASRWPSSRWSSRSVFGGCCILHPSRISRCAWWRCNRIFRRRIKFDHDAEERILAQIGQLTKLGHTSPSRRRNSSSGRIRDAARDVRQRAQFQLRDGPGPAGRFRLAPRERRFRSGKERGLKHRAAAHRVKVPGTRAIARCTWFRSANNLPLRPVFGPLPRRTRAGGISPRAANTRCCICPSQPTDPRRAGLL